MVRLNETQALLITSHRPTNCHASCVIVTHLPPNSRSHAFSSKCHAKYIFHTHFLKTEGKLGKFRENSGKTRIFFKKFCRDHVRSKIQIKFVVIFPMITAWKVPFQAFQHVLNSRISAFGPNLRGLRKILGKWTIITISRKTFFKCWQVWSHGTSHSFSGPSGIQFGLQFCFYGESYNCQLIGQGREKSLLKCKWCCCGQGTKCYIFLESSHTSKKMERKKKFNPWEYL